MNDKDYKIRNLETSILHLQVEHANTLKSLHEEIKKLQMKNSELSLELIMKESEMGETVSNIKENDDSLHEVNLLKENIVQLKADIEGKEQLMNDYQSKMKLLNNLIEKMAKNHRLQLTDLKHELNEKSEEIVRLSSLLMTVSKANNMNIGDVSQTKEPDVKAPKIFKFRNQAAVHPVSSTVKRQPIVAKHTLISTSVPMKTSKSISPHSEYMVSRLERSAYSRLIKYPMVLPPIKPTKLNVPLTSNNLHDENDMNSLPVALDNNNNNNQKKVIVLDDSKSTLQVELDQWVDINTNNNNVDNCRSNVPI